MVTVQNMKYLCILYQRQRSNYVAIKHTILVAITLKLQFKATQSHKTQNKFPANFAPDQNAKGFKGITFTGGRRFQKHTQEKG